MDIQLRVDESSATLELKGRFTFEDHQAFKAAVAAVTANAEVKVVTLDMAGLSYMDSSALGVLLLARERGITSDVRFIIKQPRQNVSAILKVVNFNKLFEVQE